MLVRLLVTAVLITAPFVLFALARGQADGMLWLIFPMIYVIPVAIVCVVLFRPSELLAAKLTLSPNVIVPVVGAIVGSLVVLFATRARTSHFWEKAQAGDLETIATAVGIVLVGGFMGVIWRLSLKIVQYFGWSA